MKLFRMKYVFACGTERTIAHKHKAGKVICKCGCMLIGKRCKCKICGTEHVAGKYTSDPTTMCKDCAKEKEKARQREFASTYREQGRKQKYNYKMATPPPTKDRVVSKEELAAIDRSDCADHDRCLDKLRKTNAKCLPCLGCSGYSAKPLDPLDYVVAHDSMTPTRIGDGLR